jgi:hypothetical protein
VACGLWLVACGLSADNKKGFTEVKPFYTLNANKSVLI